MFLSKYKTQQSLTKTEHPHFGYNQNMFLSKYKTQQSLTKTEHPHFGYKSRTRKDCLQFFKACLVK